MIAKGTFTVIDGVEHDPVSGKTIVDTTTRPAVFTDARWALRLFDWSADVSIRLGVWLYRLKRIELL